MAQERRCHHCGTAVTQEEVTANALCSHCHQHLHVCKNCFYFDGISCELERPEALHVYPGRDCPKFQFRLTSPPASS